MPDPSADPAERADPRRRSAGSASSADGLGCVHWHGPTDIVAFRFACCDGWWPCHDCHAEAADHPAKPWPRSRLEEDSVLCGACKAEMTAVEYALSGSRCPSCAAAFNPRCRPHWPLYFET